MRPIRLALLAAVVVLAALVPAVTAPAGATPTVPAHNETTLSLFSCAATRPSGFTSGTVNHSHRIAAESVTGHIDAFDCEVYNNPGLDGAVWRTYYIYDNVDGGGDKGIVGPLNVTRF